MLTARIVYDTITEMNGTQGALACALSPIGVVAQTCHETGFYHHTCGQDNTNLGGIKCSANWLDGRIPWSTRRCVTLSTGEFYNGKMGTYKLGFRWYDSLETYLKDHARLINLFYPVSKANADCVWGYVAGLYGKWATGPNYDRSVSKMVIQLAPELLDDWQDRLRNAFKEAVRRNILTPSMKAYLADVLM